MSAGEIAARRVPDLDFLKTIIGDDKSSGISRIDEMSEEEHVPRLSLTGGNKKHSIVREIFEKNGYNRSPSPPTTPLSSERSIKVKVSAKGGKGSEEEGEDGYSARYRPLKRRKAKRPESAYNLASGYPLKEQYATDPNIQDIAAFRLEQKYRELKQLLQGAHPEAARGNKLLKSAAMMAQRYHMEAYGMKNFMQAGYSPRSSKVLEQLGLDGTIYSPRRPTSAKNSTFYTPGSETDPDSYILIDGTGSQVRTRRVMVNKQRALEDQSPDTASPSSLPPRPMNYRRGRPLRRRPVSSKKKAWGGSQNNSDASPQRSKPGKRPTRKNSSSRSRTPSSSRSRSRSSKSGYSDSFDSDSSRSRSRSRSKSKSRTVDQHLKYTKNDKLLNWLKEKDKLHKEQKRKERKEKREKRKQYKLQAQEKEQKREKSELAVDKWMKEKRLLRRGQRGSPKLNHKNDDQEWIVLDEMLDLKDYGARIDPDSVPKPGSEQNPGESENGSNDTKETAEQAEEKTEGDVESDDKIGNDSATTEPNYPRPSPGRVGSAKPEGKVVSNKPVRPQSSVKSRPRSASRKKKGPSHDEWLKSKSNAPKQSKKDSSDTKEKDTLKKRIAYEEWLKTKRATSPSKEERKGVDANAKPQAKVIKGGDEEKKQASETVKIEQKQKKNGENKEKKAVEVKDPEEKEKDSDSNDDSSSTKKAEDPSPIASSRPKTAKQRPKSAKPSQKSDSVLAPKQSEDTPRSSVSTPKPELPETEAYKAVKHEQKSWDKFGDFVWSEANQVVEEEEQEGKNTDREKEELKGEKKLSKMGSVNEEAAAGKTTEEMADWGKEEEVENKKKIMETGQNDISPPLWVTENQKSEDKSDGKEVNNPADEQRGENEKQNDEEDDDEEGGDGDQGPASVKTEEQNLATNDITKEESNSANKAQSEIDAVPSGTFLTSPPE